MSTAGSRLGTPHLEARRTWPGNARFPVGRAGDRRAAVHGLLKPAGWHIGLFRFEDVAIGVAVAVAVSAVAWPGGARSALSADLVQLRTAAASYLKAVTDNRAGRGRAESELDQLRRQATAASIRAEAALSSLLSERSRPDETHLWSGAVSDANRIWYVADVLRNAAGVTASPAAVSAAARLEATAGAAPPLSRPAQPGPPLRRGRIPIRWRNGSATFDSGHAVAGVRARPEPRRWHVGVRGPDPRRAGKRRSRRLPRRDRSGTKRRFDTSPPPRLSISFDHFFDLLSVLTTFTPGLSGFSG